jgi:DNA (cytosine-5)-methyltransferase 1
MTFVPLAHTLSAEGHDASDGPAGGELYNLVFQAHPIQNATRGKSQNGVGIGDEGDPMYTLDVGSQHAVALGFDWYASASRSLNPAEVSPPLKATMQPAVAFDMQHVTRALNRQRLGAARPCPTLHQSGGAHIIRDMAVRRLTPRECERLQGFPDDWTTPAGSDSARYKALGNAVAVPVVERIGQKIVEALS